jgi:hypothetical protein
MRAHPIHCRWAVLALGAAIVSSPVPARAITFLVTDTADLPDADLSDSLCLDANGLCSLRAAIQESNLTATKDMINFSLGTGTATIDLESPLPDIVKPLTIGGGLDVVLTTTHGVPTGLTLAAGSDASSITTLIVGGFQTGIRVQSPSCLIQSSRIGTNADGSGANGNSVAGIAVEGASTSVQLNTISGNGVGVLVTANGTKLGNNSIGLTAIGSAPLPNGTGIMLSSSTGLRKLGSGADRIAYNTGDGIRIAGTSTDNEIDAVMIYNNGGSGIAVESTARNNRLWPTSIHDNGGLAIDLLAGDGSTGVTPNDSDDADTGANDLQNFPVGKAGSGFTTLRLLSAGTVIQGGLQSEPNLGFRLDFYQSPTCTEPSSREGNTKIAPSTVSGCTQVTTDATGYADIGCQLTAAVTSGWFVTAIATGAGGTSEFSECSATTTTTSAPSTTTSTVTTSTLVTTTSTTSTSSSSSTSTSSSTTSSTSTSKPSTTTVPSTTSTSSPVPTTSTSSASSSTSQVPTTSPTSTTIASTTTVPTTTLATTTTTSSSSTTTSLPPSCGDGTITQPEQCDPAIAGSQGCCNPVTCLPFAAGTSCGLERDPCGAPVCDGAGTCTTRPALLNVRCREAGAIGPCDPGAVCGGAPYCPSDDTASGCEALAFNLAANTTRLRFRCKANASDQGPVKCAADLIAPPSTAPIARRKRPAKLDATPVSDCSGPQFDTTLPKKLAQVSRAELARIIVARINKSDRQYFASGKAVCVRVRFTAGNGYSQTRLYDVRIP